MNSPHGGEAGTYPVAIRVTAALCNGSCNGRGVVPPMRRLQIHLFAPFRVLVDGTPVSEERWQGRVPRSLLKVLALSRHGCTKG